MKKKTKIVPVCSCGLDTALISDTNNTNLYACPKAFPWLVGYQDHLHFLVPQGEILYKCRICGEVSIDKYHFVKKHNPMKNESSRLLVSLSKKSKKSNCCQL